MMLTIDTGIAAGIAAVASGISAIAAIDPDTIGEGSNTRADATDLATHDQHGGPTMDRETSPTFVVSRIVPHRVQRRGMEMRLAVDTPGAPARDDAALLKVVARARCWYEDLVEDRAASVHTLAERLGMTTRYVQRVLPLALLAPQLVEQIAVGLHPATLTAGRLTDRGPMPIRWAE